MSSVHNPRDSKYFFWFNSGRCFCIPSTRFGFNSGRCPCRVWTSNSVFYVLQDCYTYIKCLAAIMHCRTVALQAGTNRGLVLIIAQWFNHVQPMSLGNRRAQAARHNPAAVAALGSRLLDVTGTPSAPPAPSPETSCGLAAHPFLNAAIVRPLKAVPWSSVEWG